MLIAIMGETFAHVSASALENGYKEQVVLIVDHSWLVNFGALFKGQRYVLCVTAASSESGSNLNAAEVLERVTETEHTLSANVDSMNVALSKRIDDVDLNSQHMVRSSCSLIEAVQSRLKQMEKAAAQSLRADEAGKKLDKKELRKIRMLARKKSQLSKMMNEQMREQNMSIDDVQLIALSWMEIADTDNSGVLDLAEFTGFFKSIDGLDLSEDQIARMFREIDSNGSGALSLDEFAQAIYSVVSAS